MLSHMSYSSCSCFCLLDRTIQIFVSCFRAVKIWFFEYNSLILTTGCSTWPLMAKNSEDLRIRIVALHKDGRGQGSATFNVKRAILAPFPPDKIHVEPQNIWSPITITLHIQLKFYIQLCYRAGEYSNHFRSEGDRNVKCSNNNNNKAIIFMYV